MKKFWKRTEGFTLVELVVVIAILGTLAGVGTVGYSGYIKKANLAADQQLIGQVRSAMELYYYSNPGTAGGYVILNQEGDTYVPAATGVTGNYNDIGDKAMIAAFGDNWTNSVFLKNDWAGVTSTVSYKDSSYFGKESGLIQTVDKLTGALGEVIERDKTMGNMLIGGEFETFLKNQKVDTNNGKAVGNAAVLYVADKTKGNEEAIKNAFTTGLSAGGSRPSQVAENLWICLRQTGIGDAAAMAAVYAYAEGYAQYSGQADKFHANTDFSAVIDASSALDALGSSFDTLDVNDFAAYAADQGNKDLQGYIDMMGTVDDNENIVSDNLNADDCFTDGTVENMLKGHAAMSSIGITTDNGQAAVVMAPGANGSVIVHVAPMNWDK